MKVILEIMSNQIKSGWNPPIGDDFMDKIELDLRYGGNLNQNMCYEIELNFPEEIMKVRLKEVVR